MRQNQQVTLPCISTFSDLIRPNHTRCPLRPLFTTQVPCSANYMGQQCLPLPAACTRLAGLSPSQLCTLSRSYLALDTQGKAVGNPALNLQGISPSFVSDGSEIRGHGATSCSCFRQHLQRAWYAQSLTACLKFTLACSFTTKNVMFWVDK